MGADLTNMPDFAIKLPVATINLLNRRNKFLVGIAVLFLKKLPKPRTS